MDSKLETEKSVVNKDSVKHISSKLQTITARSGLKQKEEELNIKNLKSRFLFSQLSTEKLPNSVSQYLRETADSLISGRKTTSRSIYDKSMHSKSKVLGPKSSKSSFINQIHNYENQLGHTITELNKYRAQVGYNLQETDQIKESYYDGFPESKGELTMKSTSSRYLDDYRNKRLIEPRFDTLTKEINIPMALEKQNITDIESFKGEYQLPPLSSNHSFRKIVNNTNLFDSKKKINNLHNSCNSLQREFNQLNKNCFQKQKLLHALKAKFKQVQFQLKETEPNSQFNDLLNKESGILLEIELMSYEKESLGTMKSQRKRDLEILKDPFSRDTKFMEKLDFYVKNNINSLETDIKELEGLTTCIKQESIQEHLTRNHKDFLHSELAKIHHKEMEIADIAEFEMLKRASQEEEERMLEMERREKEKERKMTEREKLLVEKDQLVDILEEMKNELEPLCKVNSVYDSDPFEHIRSFARAKENKENLLAEKKCLLERLSKIKTEISSMKEQKLNLELISNKKSPSELLDSQVFIEKVDSSKFHEQLALYNMEKTMNLVTEMATRIYNLILSFPKSLHSEIKSRDISQLAYLFSDAIIRFKEFVENGGNNENLSRKSKSMVIGDSPIMKSISRAKFQSKKEIPLLGFNLRPSS